LRAPNRRYVSTSIIKIISQWQSISLLKALIVQIATGYAILVVSNKEILNNILEVVEAFVAAASMLDVTIITPEDVIMVGTVGVMVVEAEAALPPPLIGDDQSPLILTFHPLNGML
jgi:hypothetical protein